MKFDKFFALAKEAGISESQIQISKSSSLTIKLFHHEIDNYQVNSSQSVVACGIYNGKFGSARTEKLDKDTFQFLIDEIKKSASFIEEETVSELFKGSEKYHKKNVFNKIPVKIPNRWMIGCLNNARNMPRFVDADTAPNISFLPPGSSFSVGTKDNAELERLVSDYVKKCKGVFSTKKQKTDEKTPAGIVDDLKKAQRLPATNSIVMPRACREDAKVGVIGSDPILVSTNFLILPVADDEKRILLASWLQSVFGQLQIEMFSTPDEGMRKLEKNSLSKVYVPDLDAIPRDIKKKLLQSFKKEPFLSLDDVKPRESDYLWALQIIPKDARYALHEGIRLLKEAYDDRVQ